MFRPNFGFGIPLTINYLFGWPFRAGFFRPLQISKNNTCRPLRPNGSFSTQNCDDLPWDRRCIFKFVACPLSCTLQGINISHLGKRKIIFKMPFCGDMLVSWRVSFGVYHVQTLVKHWDEISDWNEVGGRSSLHLSVLCSQVWTCCKKTP